MSDKVKPALTPEEWALIERGDYARLPDSVWDDLARSTPETCLGAAAVALHFAGPDGTPLFTREHVRAIRRLIPHFDGFLIGEGPSGTSVHHSEAGVRDPSQVAAEAADLLESLLPPRETKP